MEADLHIHSSCSDGSDSIKELAEKIKQTGLKIYSLTDHDTVAGCKEMAELNPAGFIPGVELTCLCGEIKCHILGYGIDVTNQNLTKLIEKGKTLRKKKLETRIEYLKKAWNFEFTEDELAWLYSRKSVVKTHLANILVKRGLADNNLDAMKKYLDGCKTGNTRFNGEEAVEVIKSAGGIPVWAHPLGGEGEIHLTREEFLPRLETMKKFGIEGLECYYSRYNTAEAEFMARCAEENSLLISGGSDYHGQNKNIPPGRLNTDSIPVDSSLLTVLRQFNY